MMRASFRRCFLLRARLEATALERWSERSPPIRFVGASLPICNQRASASASAQTRRSLAVSTSTPPTNISSCLSIASVSTHDEPNIDSRPYTHTFQRGPPLELGWATVGTHTHASVVANCGSTVVLASVACSDEVTDSESFLTVEHRQRVAGVGQIPMTNRRRSDSGQPTREEVLASRCIDRALRPLLRTKDDSTDVMSSHYHIQTSVQCFNIRGSHTGTTGSRMGPRSSVPNQSTTSGHVVATALNAAAAAMRPQLMEAVAATVLAVYSDGTIVQDPAVEPFTSTVDPVHCVGQLLYAGTKTHAVMMEWTSHAACLPEVQWVDLLTLASSAIQPILHAVDNLQDLSPRKQMRDTVPNGVTRNTNSTALEIRASLGLPPLPITHGGTEGHTERETATVPLDAQPRRRRKQLLDESIRYCREQLGNTPTLRLFGVQDETSTKDDCVRAVFMHNDPSELLSKSYRGQRETIVNEEITRLVDKFLQLESLNTASSSADNNIPLETSPSDHTWLREKVKYSLLSQALFETSFRYGTRADGRRGASTTAGWKTVRPIRLVVPALPDEVHGSALFARGDTQVLCTVTLGAPRDGQPLSDPYQPTATRTPLGETETDADESSFDKLPVGSLRFLRTQEALESDLNSRKSKADKERTGESGSLAEVKRAFLQYDFPAYSTGEVPKKGGVDRRSIGHGALAERAILPLLPDQHDFPYAIRITSEVTDSNGSSSMASVCGATLALLDAGVPMKEAVAGVSVGLAVYRNESDENDSKSSTAQYSLLLDITGTEDHYGAMDFKIAGTRQGVTAVQLDVKEPVPNEILIQALNLAKLGRIEILDVMQQQSMKSFDGKFCRPEPKQSAPRVEVVRFDPQRKRDLVGPGGAVLRQLEDRYGVSLDLTQEGQCLLFGSNREMVNKAKWTVMDLVADVVKGEVYTGTVIEIKDFGAIIELLRNKEGLLHVSELSADDDDARRHPGGNAGFVNQHLRIGQKIEVMCIGVDPIEGSVKLSRKALLEQKKKVYSGGINGKR